MCITAQLPLCCDSIRCKRPTLDIDDDVLFAVKNPAAVEKKSAGKALSDLTRAALQGQRPKPLQ